MLKFKRGMRILFLGYNQSKEGLVIDVNDTNTLISWAGGIPYWYSNNDQWLSKYTVVLCGSGDD